MRRSLLVNMVVGRGGGFGWCLDANQMARHLIGVRSQL